MRPVGECAKRRFYLSGINEAESGKFVVVWSDELTQVVYHVATLMPTSNLNKKKPIGNDFVLIVFCDSESEYNPSIFAVCFLSSLLFFSSSSVLVSDRVKRDRKKRDNSTWCTLW